MRSLPLAALAAFGLSTSVSAVDLGERPTFPTASFDRIELGQLLFYDPILSGNRNISCATCHHPRFGTGDGVSLALGEGGTGLGPDRVANPDNMPEQRLPRNAPALWNLGASEFTTFFHDGRLEDDPSQPNGIRTPLGTEMTMGFQSALAAQAMFPVLSADEMAGHYSENEVSQAVRLGFLSSDGGAWDRIAARVAEIPEYQARFNAINPDQPVTFTEIANVIADFIAFEWRADNAHFDQVMAGSATFSDLEQAGFDLFYGPAGCSDCHSGWLQTDHDFHAIALPQFGPGKAARFENHARDEGRFRVTGDPADRFAFRTPTLRNVTLTAPYGHNGAFPTLEAMIEHHADPVSSLQNYDVAQSSLPALASANDFAIMDDTAEVAAIAAANTLDPLGLSPADIEALIAFLTTLEDPAERLGVPQSVPSGLPIDQ